MKDKRNSNEYLKDMRVLLQSTIETQQYKDLFKGKELTTKGETLISDVLSHMLSPTDARTLLLLGTTCPDISLLNPFTITFDSNDESEDITYEVSSGEFSIGIYRIGSTGKTKFKATNNLAKGELKKYLLARGLKLIG